MNVVSWPSDVNQKFFAFKYKPVSNTKSTSFISGRKIAFQINTKNIMEFSCSLRLTKAELTSFYNWYNNVLGQDSGAFTCEALGENYYRFKDIPDPQDTDQKTKVLSLSIEEVF